MLRIRLFRVGKKNQPAFRIVVTDKKNPPRGGRSVEILGFFNPLTKEKGIKKERVQYWISQGAQPSDTCHNLFVAEGIIKEAKISVHAKTKKAEEKTEATEPKNDEKESKAEEKTEATEPKNDEKESKAEEKTEATEPKNDEKESKAEVEIKEPDKADEKEESGKAVDKEDSEKQQKEKNESSEGSKEDQKS